MSISHLFRRLPLYLKRSLYVLFQMLSMKLEYPLKKKLERQFIYLRLYLFDQQYRLNNEQQLWLSYQNLALQYHQWPVRLVLFFSSSFNIFHF